MVERYPDCPPYGGDFPEVIPHLTIADVDASGQLDSVEREFMHQYGAQLPVTLKNIAPVQGWETIHPAGRREIESRLSSRAFYDSIQIKPRLGDRIVLVSVSFN